MKTDIKIPISYKKKLKHREAIYQKNKLQQKQVGINTKDKAGLGFLFSQDYTTPAQSYLIVGWFLSEANLLTSRSYSNWHQQKFCLLC